MRLHFPFCFQMFVIMSESQDWGTGRDVSGVWQGEWTFSAKEEDAQACILATAQSSMFFSFF